MFKHYFELVEGASTYPLISLGIFFLFFAGVLWWFFTADTKKLDEIAQLPLNDDSTNPEKNNNSHEIK